MPAWQEKRRQVERSTYRLTRPGLRELATLFPSSACLQCNKGLPPINSIVQAEIIPV